MKMRVIGRFTHNSVRYEVGQILDQLALDVIGEDWIRNLVEANCLELVQE